MKEFDKEIKELEEKLEKIRLRREERANQTDVGVISITNNGLKIELLLNESDFSEEHIEKLTQVANDLQNLLLDVYKDINKEEEK